MTGQFRLRIFLHCTQRDARSMVTNIPLLIRVVEFQMILTNFLTIFCMVQKIFSTRIFYYVYNLEAIFILENHKTKQIKKKMRERIFVFGFLRGLPK